MTARGLIVTEIQEDLPGLPAASESSSSAKADEPPLRKSPIAELLYMRWLEGLKIKWPSLI